MAWRLGRQIKRQKLRGTGRPLALDGCHLKGGCGAHQCGTKTRLLLPLTSFLTSFFFSGFVFVTQVFVDATDFSN